MNKEIWKPIYFVDNGKLYDYRGYYEVSNLGNIRSVDRIVSHWKGGVQLRKSIILKQGNNNGYKHIVLNKNGKTKLCKVHRLVAFMFLPNPDSLPIINHKDENPSNNCVENLEWCSYKYNTNYGTCIQRRVEKIVKNHLTSKPVMQFTLDGTFVNEYKSIIDAEQHTGVKCQSICACCKGKKMKDGKGFYYTRKSAGGYIWRYKEKEVS